MDTPKQLGGWKAFDFGTKTPKQSNNSNGINENTNTRGISKTNFSRPLNGAKSFSFQAKLTPKTVSELAVHPKKLQELQNCLLEMLSQRNEVNPHFLLLTGPSGSGKATALRVICEEFGVGIDEWINPVDQDYEITHENQFSQFLDFLLSSKWQSLFQNELCRVTVVKEFPNTIIRQPDQFRSVLEECWYKTKSPIVFICTEVHNKSVNLCKILFPDDIIRDFRIRRVEFNACAPTLLKTAIKRAQKLIKDHTALFVEPLPAVVDAIVTTSMGDIRNAMNQFYLSSLKGGGIVPLVSDKKEIIGVKRKKRTNPEVKIKTMERDTSLGLFHGLGRVLNPKWTSCGGSERLNCDIEKLIDEFSSQSSVFVTFLFENYLKYFGEFNDVVKAADFLSISEKFLSNYGERDEISLYGLWVSILGLMVSNRHKVSKWTQIRAPVRAENKIVNDVNLIGYDKFDIFYCNLIKSCVCDTLLKNTENADESDEICIEDDDL